MSSPTPRRSPLAMVLLSLVAEAPMHPYRMQQLIRERRKDQVVNVAQRNSIYQTIERLKRAGLIEVRESSRDERRPERTVYGITDEGTRTLHEWLGEMLSAPAREFPQFPAALAFLPLVSVKDAIGYFEARVDALSKQLVEMDAELDGVDLPRLFLLEDEYIRALIEAELHWLRALIDDLRTGEITWDASWLAAVAEHQV
jgi:DNA-binding PadR family transcriptional regulator